MSECVRASAVTSAVGGCQPKICCFCVVFAPNSLCFVLSADTFFSRVGYLAVCCFLSKKQRSALCAASVFAGTLPRFLSLRFLLHSLCVQEVGSFFALLDATGCLSCSGMNEKRENV